MKLDIVEQFILSEEVSFYSVSKKLIIGHETVAYTYINNNTEDRLILYINGSFIYDEKTLMELLSRRIIPIHHIEIY